MRNKGFTLIELLAVIVILAIVALIATPLIMGVIEKAQTSAYEASLRGIFEATDLYVASDEFNGFPGEGIAIVDDNIKLKNKEFTSGKIIKNEEGQLVLQDISNGVYCGNGTINDLVVVKGNCYSADTTPPTDVSIGSSTVTSNSITIVAAAMDVESAISGYEFSSDDGSTWTSIQTSNVYTFTGLINNTNYTFKIRANNNNDLTTESSSLTVSTNDIPLPTYAISTSDWTDSAVVTITYPERKEGYVYEYSLDNASTWEEVTSPSISKDITFTNNGSVIARISDGVNEVSATSYDVANIDTTAPVITVNPAIAIAYLGNAYTDSGVTANDSEMGDITSDIVVTGNVDTSTEGTYTLTYNVSDAAGNAATEATKTVHVVEPAYLFSYTGNYQTFTAPITATYKLELWGAEGGDGGSYSGEGGYGGKGGYATGNINLSSGEKLYVYIGGQGNIGNHQNKGGSGGGAADIRTVAGSWNNSASLNSRIIVAGGGGGATGYHYSWTSLGNNKYNGGGGGGTNGIAGYYGGSSSSRGGGGTQASGGSAGTGSYSDTSAGSFGYGGSGGNYSGGGASGGWNGGGGGGYGYGGGGGAGGGWYGGGGGNGGSALLGAGGGGSSYLGGVSSGQTLSGNQSMPNPNGGMMTGRTGHGYVKITAIEG